MLGDVSYDKATLKSGILVFTVFTHVLAEETTVTTVDSVTHSIEQLGPERMIE